MANAGEAYVIPDPQEFFRVPEMQVPGCMKPRKLPAFIKVQ